MKSGSEGAPEPSLEVFSCPSDYAPSYFFTRYSGAFLAPIFRESLAALGRSKGIDAIQLWGWTFDNLSEKIGINRDVNQISRYAQDHREGHIMGSSTRVSEVYKSSYLRVLEALHASGKINRSQLFEFSAKICPVDLSLWNIGFSQRPDWWPSARPRGAGVNAVEAWEATAILALQEDAGARLFYAAGVFAEGNENSLQKSAFRLTPFAYKVVGGKIPEAARVEKLLKSASWSVDPEANSALSALNAPLSGWSADQQHGFRIGDLLVLPLAARVQTTNINSWQCARELLPPVLPSAYLVGEGEVERDENSWRYLEDGVPLFTGQDWLDGPIDRIKDSGFIRHGQFAFADRNWLDRLLAEKECKLAFVQEHIYLVRKDEYSEPETSHFFAYLGLDRLIS
jgi:hypothetical protein